MSIFEDFDTLNLTSNFIKQIEEYNEDFSKNQSHSIKKTLEILEKKISLETIEKKSVKKQVELASKWCHKYDIPINQKSNYLNGP